MNGKEVARLVVEAVCNITNLSENQILNKCRLRDSVNARKIVMYILRDQHHMGFAQIGKLLQCNHSTVMHHYNYVINNYLYDPDIKMLKDIVDGTTSKEIKSIKKSIYKILDDRYKSLDDKLNILIDVLKNEKGNISQYNKLRLEGYSVLKGSEKASKDVEKINIHDLYNWKDS